MKTQDLLQSIQNFVSRLQTRNCKSFQNLTDMQNRYHAFHSKMPKNIEFLPKKIEFYVSAYYSPHSDYEIMIDTSFDSA